jgi:hypothetical protein
VNAIGAAIHDTVSAEIVKRPHGAGGHVHLVVVGKEAHGLL